MVTDVTISLPCVPMSSNKEILGLHPSNTKLIQHTQESCGFVFLRSKPSMLHGKSLWKLWQFQQYVPNDLFGQDVHWACLNNFSFPMALFIGRTYSQK